MGKERDVASKGDLSIAQTAERKVAKALVDAVGATSETVSVGQPIATSEKKEKMKVKSRQATVKNAGTQLKNSIKAEKTATKNIGRSKYDKTRFTKKEKHQADEEAEQDAKVQSMTTEKGYKNHMKKTADKYARKKVDLQKKIDINQIKSVESRSLLLPEMLKRVENAKIRVDLKTRAGGVARAVAQAVKGIQKQSKEAKIKQETLLQAADDKRSLAKAELTKAKTAKTTEVLKDQGSDKTCDNCHQAEAELAAKDKEISKDKKKLLNAKEDSKMQAKVAATTEQAEKDAVKDIKVQKSAQKAINPKGKKAAAKKAEAKQVKKAEAKQVKKAEAKPGAKGKDKAKATNKKPVDELSQAQKDAKKAEKPKL